jgi:hypothetical protein
MPITGGGAIADLALNPAKNACRIVGGDGARIEATRLTGFVPSLAAGQMAGLAVPFRRRVQRRNGSNRVHQVAVDRAGNGRNPLNAILPGAVD